MKPFELKKATRRQMKIKVGLAGSAGSGKTMSALLLAYGITGDWSKIALVDAENRSSELYVGLKAGNTLIGDFNVIPITPPFSPERYIEAMNVCIEHPEIEVVIVDSMSHEWDGKGGVLEIHNSMPGNSFTNWGKLTPRHNRFIETIVQSPKFMICTMRTKQDYVLVEKNGKQVPEKVGLKAITREGVDYEFTLCFDIDIKHHAVASKDRTSLFMDKPDFVITEDTGKTLLEWCNTGELEIPQPTIAELQKEYTGLIANSDHVLNAEDKAKYLDKHTTWSEAGITTAISKLKDLIKDREELLHLQNTNQ